MRLFARPVLVLVAGLFVTLLAFHPASRLRVQTDLTALLPAGSPAAEGYRAFLERFGGLEKVFLVVLPGEAGEAGEGELLAAASLLAERLAVSPEVASVRAGLEERDEELFLRYVAPRALLLLPEDALAAARARLEPAAIRARAASLRAALGTPFGEIEAEIARADPLGFSADLPLSFGAGSLSLDFLSSSFVAADGGAALLILTPARSEIDPEGGRRLLAEIRAAADEMRQQLGAPLEVRALGGPLYAAQDEELLRRDLRWTLTGTCLGTTLLLLLAFEGIWLPFAALAPLLAALVWAAAGVGLARGEISAVSIGFGAVLVGRGVDYGIHLGTRFRQTYLRQDPIRATTRERSLGALGDTLRHAGPGILTSAFTTAAGFAVLTGAHFRPLEELGLLVALGILSVLLAVLFLGGAGLVLVAPRLRPPGPAWRFLGSVASVSRFATRQPVAVLTVAALLSIVGLWGITHLSIDPDLRNLRPYDHPAHATETLLGERFGLGLDTATVVVQGDDLAMTLERARRAGEILHQHLGGAAEITNPADYLTLGEGVDERLRELSSFPFERAADDLERELVAVGLAPRAFARGLDALRALGRGEDPGAPPPQAWPDWLADSLRDDADGSWAALRLRLPLNAWPEGPPPDLVRDLEDAVPGVALASVPAIAGELRALALGDLETLSFLALVVVAGVIVFSFRGNVRYSVLAGLPVILGSLWTLGLWSGCGQSLDLFSLAVLPILLGIGVDDGLHVAHGARRDPALGAGGSIGRGVQGASRALTLTTLTTCVGFSSLGLSHIPGLRSGGLLITVGVLACWLATLLVLPALEAIGEKRHSNP